jgi:murein DD-endopeptidase MepM/ murein hydrolase activator NlpD
LVADAASILATAKKEHAGMAKDDRFYSFIIAHTSRSRARVQRIRIERKFISIASAVSVVIAAGLVFGLYGLTQQAAHLRTEYENQRLRAENDRQRQELEKLNNRVEKVEDTSRKLAEKSGVVQAEPMPNGTGGPELPLDEMGLATLAAKTSKLEADMSAYEEVLRQRGYTPTIWPVEGKLEGGFGGRRNPFGGSGWEFHTGQDIEAPMGAEVIAGASGRVSFSGWMNGYGQLVIVDHGGGLTTRYGHLSHIDVEVGQQLSRGQLVGKVGSTGRSTGPHLHYEVRINDQAVNPLQYLLLSTKK